MTEFFKPIQQDHFLLYNNRDKNDIIVLEKVKWNLIISNNHLQYVCFLFYSVKLVTRLVGSLVWHWTDVFIIRGHDLKLDSKFKNKKCRGNRSDADTKKDSLIKKINKMWDQFRNLERDF